MKYYYDLFDRVVKEEYYNSSGTLQGANHYVYNSEGVLAKQYATNANGVQSKEYRFEYDSLGRLIRSSEANGNTTVQRTEHFYDTANRLTEQSWVLGSTPYAEHYTYNDPTEDDGGDSSLASIETAIGTTMQYGYDDLKRVTSVSTAVPSGTGFTRRYSYQNLTSNQTTGRVRYFNYREGNSSNGTVIGAGYEYSYDAAGYISRIKQDGAIAVEYSYDSLGQLTRVNDYDNDLRYAYTYDTAGNICSETATGVYHSNQNYSHSYAYGNASWTDLLTSFDDHAIAYEGQTLSGNNVTGTVGSGNPINWYNGTSYTGLTWAKGRQLGSLTTGNKTYSFAYDMSGVRIAKNDGTLFHNYVTQSGRVVRETVYSSSGVFQYALDFFYDANGQPYALRYYTNESLTNFATYYYILNLQGDVVALYHATAGTVAEYSYDAWGRLLRITDASGNEITGTTNIAIRNPLRYRGYYYDTETGFYYLQSRYYDPIVKRFLNADAFASTGQGFLGYNMFAYCENNPVMSQDPTGEIMISTLILIGAAVIGAAVATYSAVKSRKSGCDWSDTIFYALADGLMAFCAVYTLGMTAYGCYENWCYLNGKTPVTEIGTSTSPVPAVPQEAYDTYDYVSSHNGTPRQGCKGGKVFLNDGRDGGAVLPNSYAPFYEYDIYPKVTGIDRGPERIIISHSGHAAWYTSNHYQSFVRMEIK